MKVDTNSAYEKNEKTVDKYIKAIKIQKGGKEIFKDAA